MEEDEIFLDGYEIKFTSTSLELVPFIQSKTNETTTFVKLSVCCQITKEKVAETILPRTKPFMLLQVRLTNFNKSVYKNISFVTKSCDSI